MASSSISTLLPCTLASRPSSPLGFSSTLSLASPSLCSRPSDRLSLQSPSSPRISVYPSVVCGRGDKRTAKGKRFRKSYGNSRPKNPDKGRGLPMIPLPTRPPKKDPLDDGDFVEIVIDESLFTSA